MPTGTSGLDWKGLATEYGLGAGPSGGTELGRSILDFVAQNLSMIFCVHGFLD